jgi:tRNA dimethylallyltransferase
MQIYRGMDIGTAKATEDERRRARHHMLDMVSPTEDFSVDNYKRLALLCASEISARGGLPIFVGGTGLYIDALMRGDAPGVPPSDKEYRDAILSEIKDDEDIDRLWKRLLSVDPESAEKIHKNNVKRVIRALEIYDRMGVPKSVLDKQSRERGADIDIGMLVLDFHDRETLYGRIDMRVDMMIRDGLVDEVKELYDAGQLIEDTTAYQAIGYKELIGYIRGERQLSECVEEIKLASRRYAKRQLTWFRHEESATTLYMDMEDGKMRDIDEVISEASLFVNRKLNEEK